MWNAGANNNNPKKIEMTEASIELSKFITRRFYGEEQIIPTIDISNFNRDLDKKNIKSGDIFYGKIDTTVKRGGKRARINNFKGIFQIDQIVEVQGQTTITVKDSTGDVFKTSKSSLVIASNTEASNRLEDWVKEKRREEATLRAEMLEREMNNKGLTLSTLRTEAKIKSLYEAGVRNMWLVGPAGCGKSTLCRYFAKETNIPFLVISCSIGTSATEFVGYKYPTREKTKFAELYSIPSVIVIDEMPALDPSVAQVLNAALANGEIETTTGLVQRHKNCLIIATSNTYGAGADRQYVANNQLDSSTIDRFVGGIIEVDYSEEYESQYDKEVVEFVRALRSAIKDNNLRRIASTRMVEAGHIQKYSFIKDWKQTLIQDWSKEDRELLKQRGVI